MKLYTVRLGQNVPMQKGVARIEIKLKNPLAIKIADAVFNKSAKLWDQKLVPAMTRALQAKGVKNIRFPAGNFFIDKDGNLKPANAANSAVAKARGYVYCARKGFDTTRSIAWLYVVVS